MTPYTPETAALRTSPPCTHARGRGCLWWDPPRTCHNSSRGQYPGVWARACGASAQVRRGQERARSSQRGLCLLSACGVLALQRSRSTLSPFSLPVQSQAGRGCQRYLVQPPAAALGGGQAVSTGQGLSKAPVSAVWKSFQSESEHIIPPFFPPPLPFVPPRTPRGLLLPVTQGEGSRLPLFCLDRDLPGGGSRGWEDWTPGLASAGGEAFTFWQGRIP